MLFWVHLCTCQHICLPIQRSMTSLKVFQYTVQYAWILIFKFLLSSIYRISMYMKDCSLILHSSFIHDGRPDGICCLIYFLQMLWDLNWISCYFPNDVIQIFITDGSWYITHFFYCYFYVPIDISVSIHTDGMGHILNFPNDVITDGSWFLTDICSCYIYVPNDDSMSIDTDGKGHNPAFKLFRSHIFHQQLHLPVCFTTEFGRLSVVQGFALPLVFNFHRNVHRSSPMLTCFADHPRSILNLNITIHSRQVSFWIEAAMIKYFMCQDCCYQTHVSGSLQYIFTAYSFFGWNLCLLGLFCYKLFLLFSLYKSVYIMCSVLPGSQLTIFWLVPLCIDKPSCPCYQVAVIMVLSLMFLILFTDLLYNPL